MQSYERLRVHAELREPIKASSLSVDLSGQSRARLRHFTQFVEDRANEDCRERSRNYTLCVCLFRDTINIYFVDIHLRTRRYRRSYMFAYFPLTKYGS